MLQRSEKLQKIEAAGVIAVLRGATRDEATKSAHALIKGGVKGIEVTFTVPEANLLIDDLRADYKDDQTVVIGAGTVLDAITARLALMAGAEFIVSPSYSKDVAEICNLYQIPYIPGCATITEMQTALISGSDIVKLFPGNLFGPDAISSFKAPMPHLSIMPSGGVSIDNMAEWFKAGVVCVGVGGNLLKPAATGEFDKVTDLAADYMRKLAVIKGELNG